MAARIARHNGGEVPLTAEGTLVLDWNGTTIVPGELTVVDDANALVIAAVDAGTLELDPTLGRHYEAGPTERRIRPTEGAAGGIIPRTPGEVRS